MNKDITVCLASCNRFDLLQKTLNSFFSLNKYPIKRFIITEDSTVEDMRNKILSIYGNKVELVFNETNLGPFKTFDNMYNLVDTEYIFHCEDDWLFESNPNFMAESLNILEERGDINQVWIRKDADPSWIEQPILTTTANVKYQMIKNPHLDEWCGFSGNPGLRRKSDYKRIFPNGYSEFIIPDIFAGFTELACNRQAAKNGYRAAILANTSINHIGHGRTTIK